MRQHTRADAAIVLLVAFLALGLLLLMMIAILPPTTRAEGPQASCLQNACAANCVAYQFALGHRNLDIFSR